MFLSRVSLGCDLHVLDLNACFEPMTCDKIWTHGFEFRYSHLLSHWDIVQDFELGDLYISSHCVVLCECFLHR